MRTSLAPLAFGILLLAFGSYWFVWMAFAHPASPVECATALCSNSSIWPLFLIAWPFVAVGIFLCGWWADRMLRERIVSAPMHGFR